MMKRSNVLYIVLFSAWILVGCNGFLEESSQSEVRPSTVEELYQVMLGEAYPNPGSDIVMPYLEFFTDNMQSNAAVSDDEKPLAAMECFKPLFTWKKEMYEECAKVDGMNTWDLYYKRIGGCNVVLDYMNRVSGDVERKLSMEGQVRMLRGWWYFQLVNLYGLPYNVGDPAKNPGVPLKLTMEVTGELFVRKSVAEVYAQVEKDLLSGTNLLEKYGKETSKWKMTSLAGKALLSRMYLYMENWDKAIVYADSVLAVQGSLCRFVTFPDLENAINGDQGTPESGVYNSKMSNEILWMYGSQKECTLYTSFLASKDPASYTISEDLIHCFERWNAPGNDSKEDVGDLRRVCEIISGKYNDAAWQPVSFAYWVTRQGRQNTFSYSTSLKGVRTAELYLNRAEAYAQKYRATGNVEFRVKALADLNTLRASRFDTRHVVYVPVEKRVDLDVSTADRLYAFCLLERRRELMFEDHRWFDLRRTGMPRLERVMVGKQGDAPTTYVLEAASPHYVLPIPESVMRDNTKLEQNKY